MSLPAYSYCPLESTTFRHFHKDSFNTRLLIRVSFYNYFTRELQCRNYYVIRLYIQGRHCAVLFGRIDWERLPLTKIIWHVYSTDLINRLSSLVPFVRVDAHVKESIDNDPRKTFKSELKYTVTNNFESLITKK